MTEQSSIERRLQFAGITAQTSAVLRQNKDFVLEVMPPILDGFYAHVGKFSETAGMFRGQPHMAHAKEMQIRHWRVILDGRFDQAYETSVKAIGEVHNKLGLEPRWYIGGYNVLIAGLTQAIADRKSGWFDRGARQARTDLQTAIAQAALLDMDLAISVYLEAGRRDRSEAIARLAGEFETTVGGVVNIVASAATELQAVAQTLTAATDRTAEQTVSVSTASEETSLNVRAVAAAAEELTSSIGEISRLVNESAEVSGNAASSATETRTKMSRLEEGVQKIGSIVDLIASVAEQTNLLALNATIEAARAGDAGRGFAVVAQEVKSLAEQTAKATADIAAQIQTIQSATSESVTSIASITGVVGNIREIATAIASAVEEQGAATNEIARNVQQAATGTDAIAGNMAVVTRSAAEAGETASHVFGSASELSQQAELLRREVAKFLTHARAA